MSTVEPGRTALAVVVPEAEPLVGAFRTRFNAVAIAQRIPAHVTVLVPWVPQAELADGVAIAQDALGALKAFDAQLTRVERFPEHVWLAPEPRERFVELTRAIEARFPEHPPYGGAFDELEPHLTIGESAAGGSSSDLQRLAQAELGARLPLAFRVDRVTVLALQADEGWDPVTVLPLRP